VGGDVSSPTLVPNAEAARTLNPDWKTKPHSYTTSEALTIEVTASQSLLNAWPHRYMVKLGSKILGLSRDTRVLEFFSLSLSVPERKKKEVTACKYMTLTFRMTSAS
jgi:hypothetical protein